MFVNCSIILGRMGVKLLNCMRIRAVINIELNCVKQGGLLAAMILELGGFECLKGLLCLGCLSRLDLIMQGCLIP